MRTPCSLAVASIGRTELRVLEDVDRAGEQVGAVGLRRHEVDVPGRREARRGSRARPRGGPGPRPRTRTGTARSRSAPSRSRGAGRPPPRRRARWRRGRSPSRGPSRPWPMNQLAAPMYVHAWNVAGLAREVLAIEPHPDPGRAGSPPRRGGSCRPAARARLLVDRVGELREVGRCRGPSSRRRSRRTRPRRRGARGSGWTAARRQEGRIDRREDEVDRPRVDDARLLQAADGARVRSLGRRNTP